MMEVECGKWTEYTTTGEGNKQIHKCTYAVIDYSTVHIQGYEYGTVPSLKGTTSHVVWANAAYSNVLHTVPEGYAFSYCACTRWFQNSTIH